MTDTELLHEVEQAMLGAMMTRPLRVGGLPGPVVPALFTDGRHQAIAAALTGTAGEERGLIGRLRGWFARHGRRAREDRAYLEELPGLCPDSGHMESYFDILRQARSQREARARAAMNQAADAAQVLEGAADQLAVQTGGAARAVAPGELPDDVARQARALASHARQISQTASMDPLRYASGSRQAAPARQSQQAARWALAPQAAAGRVAPRQAGQTANGQVLSVPSAQQARQPVVTGRPPAQAAGAGSGPQPSAAPSTDQLSRGDAEDLLLSALMRRPDLAREIVASFPPDRFENGPRRELYTMIAEFVAERRPLDPLTLAWAADERTPAGPHGGRDSWVSPDYIRRIAGLPPVPGNPAWLGRLLLSDGPDTPAPSEPETREPDTSLEQDQEQEPGPQRDENRTAEPEPSAETGQAGTAKRAAPPEQRAPAEPAPAPAPVEPPPPEPSQPGPAPRM